IPTFAGPPTALMRPMRAIWQVGPAGTRFLSPVTLTMPNVSGDLPGKSVLVLAWDATLNLLAPAGLARVSADGKTVQTDPLTWSSLEYFGYAEITAAEQDSLAAGKLQGGARFRGPVRDSLFTPPPRFRTGASAEH